MKSILISIKPEWVALILNGTKTIEIRKTMPKCELPIKCYIYCTKGKQKLLEILHKGEIKWFGKDENDRYEENIFIKQPFSFDNINKDKWLGKVVAEFTLSRVEEFDYFYSPAMGVSGYRNQNNEMLPYDKCCLKKEEIVKYADDGQLLPKPVFAWYIDNLKIYDTPKELCNFSAFIPNNKCEEDCARCNAYNKEYNTCLACMNLCKTLKRPPQSWCYVEEE